MAKSEMLVQVELMSKHDDGNGATHRTCWVEPKVKIGDRITLKNSLEPDRLWLVTHVGVPKPRAEVKTDWHNNI